MGVRGLASETWVVLTRALAITVICLAFTGCTKFFAAQGVLASEGGFLGAWSSVPEGCTRDPFDGLPAPESSTVLAFVWDDPSVRDPLRDLHRPTAPNAPMRLELWHEGSSYALNLDTVKTQDTHLDSTTCSTLAVETHVTPKTLPEGRPTLSGTLRLDCRVSAGGLEPSHITANIPFQRCEF